MEQKLLTYPQLEKDKLKNRFILLKYNTQIDKDAYKKWLKNTFKTPRTVTDVRMAHEKIVTDDKLEKITTYVCIAFDGAIQNDKKIFIWDKFEPTIYVLKNGNKFNTALKLFAIDPANKDLHTDKSYAQAIWSCKSLEEALIKYCEKPGDAMGIKVLYEQKPIAKKIQGPLAPLSGYTYQRYIMNHVIPLSLGDPKLNRYIHLFVDFEGRKEKTDFVNNLLASSNAFACIPLSGKVNDLCSAIDDLYTSGQWTGEVLFLDLPRGGKIHPDLFVCLEVLKGGKIPSYKYHSKFNSFASGRLAKTLMIMFINDIPELENFSLDRWIANILQDGKMYNITSRIKGIVRKDYCLSYEQWLEQKGLDEELEYFKQNKEKLCVNLNDGFGDKKHDLYKDFKNPFAIENFNELYKNDVESKKDESDKGKEELDEPENVEENQPVNDEVFAPIEDYYIVPHKK